MRLLFLNQYFPPDPAPTGALLAELAEALRAEGVEVECLSAGADYRTGQQKGGRLRREAYAWGRLLWAGLRARRADAIVSATSPPCLLLAATLVAWWHRARSIHWAMDLYPELAVALGEVPVGFLARALAAAMGWCYRRASKVVALDEDMVERLRVYRVEAEIIRPWVFRPILPHLEELRTSAQWKSPAGPPWTWIYSGNLGRAHEWETLLQAQAELERRDEEIRLVFQGGGPSRSAAQERAADLGLRRCEWRGYQEEEQVAASLLEGHVSAVTQVPAARGLLWPSKLGLLLSLPRPIAWVGEKEGAIGRALSAQPHAGVFAPGEGVALAHWVLNLKAHPAILVEPAVDARRHRAEALSQWKRIFGFN